MFRLAEEEGERCGGLRFVFGLEGAVPLALHMLRYTMWPDVHFQTSRGC